MARRVTASSQDGTSGETCRIGGGGPLTGLYAMAPAESAAKGGPPAGTPYSPTPRGENFLPWAPPPPPPPPRERPSLHVLHDDVLHVAVGAGVEDAHHAGMVELRGRLGLPAKPPHEGLVARVVLGEHLDGHRAPQDRVGPLVHLGHPSAPDGP